MGLLERADARHQLDGWWAEARSGRGRFVLVEGEAGVGKTTFLDDFASRERERRAEVVWTGCEPGTAPRPLGPLRDLGLAPDPDSPAAPPWRAGSA